MELNINIKTNNNCECGIIIEDISTYLSEDSTSFQKGSFRESDTISMVLLYLNTIENPSIKSITFNKEIPIKFDGWFTVYYVVLPTKQWFQNALNTSSQVDILGVYDSVYYTDGTNIYKYNPKTQNITQVIDLSEIIEINPVNTTISVTSKDYVSICFLDKCYVNLCQQIFENRGLTQCWNKNNIDSELIYKRDLVWMAINVIKYMVECNQLYEAERIIELLHSCNGVCSDKKIKNNVKGCGCS